ncbi:Dynein regulatory complex subunit 7 [Schistosoma japonicum]|nr:Dynein regulatory complex subunit 7 [Schistosoma japonicum]KAH8855848.1 Dynein regulatory complex subunit 7 [Schistosoma japonicum]KAH8855849.1 Dynein regulatory complex subunit 7 [Schistosoma japonicum]
MGQTSTPHETELNQTQGYVNDTNDDVDNILRTDDNDNDDDTNVSEKIQHENDNEIEESTSLNEFGASNPPYLPDNYDKLPESFDLSTFPKSYKENNVKELQLLKYCENFCRQYSHLCPDRTKLLLTPKNECDIEKFVCTTLSKTELSYPELYTWNSAAKFVADFLNFVPLFPVTELPKRLLSPMTTIDLQKGTCFEYATLLCSLLLSVGYDAYVVSGYATRECCYMDETRDTCPYLNEDDIKDTTNNEKSMEPEQNRYVIKPARDLASKYEQTMAMKDLQNEAERIKQAKIEAELNEEEHYKPSIDPLFGLRIHAWILILPGKREVPEAFFIETLTGLAKPLDSSMYLGIESLWNDHNYWVNMQDCSTGISHLNYNLNNNLHWEYLLPNNSLAIQQNEISYVQQSSIIHSNNLFNVQSIDNKSTTPLFITPNSLKVKTNTNFNVTNNPNHDVIDVTYPVYNDLYSKSLNKLQQLKSSSSSSPLLLNLPPSWTLPIQIDLTRYKLRYPNGYKKKLYKYSIVEKFSPYSQLDGLILKLTIFQDRELTQPNEIREIYANRKDKLIKRSTMLTTNWIIEKFNFGRSPTQLAEHGYYKIQQGIHTYRYMKFYNEARYDGLYKREQTYNTMTEYYSNRLDHLYYRKVYYGNRIKKFGPAQQQNKNDVTMSTCNQLNIDKIIEKFTRNEEIKADEDIAERIFNIVEEKIILIYHIDKEHIIPCTREFIKPSLLEDRQDTIQIYPDTHSTFQVDIFAKPKTQLEIYQILINLLKDEEKSKELIHKSESEIHSILNERTIEDLHILFNIDHFDTLHNKEMNELRIELEKLAEIEKTHHNKLIEYDYLAPYLIQINVIHNIKKLSYEQALIVHNQCLNDYKQRLINKANIIQSCYEKEVNNLLKKQQWYHLNQMNLSKDDEQAYLCYCNNVTYKINLLESLLAWHKQTAPIRYMDLQKKLQSDSRLCELIKMN